MADKQITAYDTGDPVSGVKALGVDARGTTN